MSALRSNQADHEWFAVQSWAGREPLCAKHLVARGYDVFLPCYREQRRWSDRTKTIERALFAGYLFCRLHRDVVAKIISSPGVVRIVGNNDGPLPISGHEVEAIQRIIEARVTAQPWPYLQIGQRVRVDTGPLRDMEGIVVMIKNRRRLVVSIAQLQRSVAVELDADCVTVSRARAR